jgi:hypothetical protein
MKHELKSTGGKAWAERHGRKGMGGKAWAERREPKDELQSKFRASLRRDRY